MGDASTVAWRTVHPPKRALWMSSSCHSSSHRGFYSAFSLLLHKCYWVTQFHQFGLRSVTEPLNCIKLLSVALLSHSIASNWSPRCYWVAQLHQIVLRGVTESLNCIKLVSAALLSRSIPLNCSPRRFWAAQQLDVVISLSTLLIFRSLQSIFHLLSFCIAFP